MQAACLSVLNHTANNAKAVLRAFYRKGYNSWQKGVKEKPYAIVIPDGQGDRRRVAELVSLLRAQKIEVSRATAGFTVKEGTFPARQLRGAARPAVPQLRGRPSAAQKFPADAEHQPYDDISWALPVHYGVEATPVGDEGVRQAAVELLQADPQPAGEVTGTGALYVLKDTGQEALLAARARLAAFSLSVAEQAFKLGDVEYPAGSWLIPDQAGLRPALVQVARELALDFAAAPEAPAGVPSHAAPVPRLAIWHAWADTQAAGWVRLTLDRQNVPYAYISDDDIRAGGLEDRFDVIVWPENESDLQEQIHGIDRRSRHCPTRRRPTSPATACPTPPTTSPAASGGRVWAACSSSSNAAGC